MLNKKALAGTPSTPPVFVEDVFSTYLYTGTGATRTITNNIDLSGKGGLVWLKERSGGEAHGLFDTLRGATYELQSANNGGHSANVTTLTAFTSSGFTVGTNGSVNGNALTYASWTFRKQAKFFDVVTYTGTGSARTVSHNLGSVPGMIIVKRTDTTANWAVYHRSLTSSRYSLLLNLTGAEDLTDYFSTTAPTSSAFTVGTNAVVNASGGTYVAYLFAHDAGGFGTAGTDNVISCGSYTGNGSTTGPVVTLGYEPQWLLIKRTSGGTGNWFLVDNMRGLPVGSNSSALFPNTSGAEDTSAASIAILSTGFQPRAASIYINNNTDTYIYIAIRRGPMKTPTSGTSVFDTDAAGANASANGEVFSSTFPVDFHFRKPRSSSANGWFSNSRLIPGSSLSFQSTSTEASLAYVDKYDRMSGIATTNGFDYTDWAGWLFKRAPGFFDIVCFTYAGTALTVPHNLTVVPELIIEKSRSATTDWIVYHKDLPSPLTNQLQLNSTSGYVAADYFQSLPTSTNFFTRFISSATWVAYLFATLAGVSKVGSYTGTGTTQTINCGFTAGARFVMIKRTDSTGDWYVWDTARGIVSGNDPYLLLNDTAAEVTNTDYIDPVNSGFELSSTAPAAINANGGSFIFMAIA